MPRQKIDIKIRKGTLVQYSRISGKWDKYFNRLRNIRGRHHLSVEYLLSLLEHQKGLCALSGVPLTCTLERGTVSTTNASIDRITHGEPYTQSNIRLVCAIVNKMRWTMSDEELKMWCRKIINNDES